MITYFTTAPRAKAGPGELAQHALEWRALVSAARVGGFAPKGSL